MSSVSQSLGVRTESAAQWSVVALFAAFPLSLGLANVLMLLVLLLWVLGRGWHDRWMLLKGNPVAWMALGLYAWMCVGLLYTPAAWSDAQEHLGKYFKLPYMLVVITLLPDAVWRRRAMWAFLLAMMFTLASTYANIWWQLPWSRTQNLGWGYDHTVIKDYISQGLMVSMLALVALAAVLNRRCPPRWRWVCGMVAVAAIISVTHLSHGRTGYLAVLAALGAFALFAVQGWKRLAVVWVVGLAIGGLYLSSPSLQGRVDQAVAEARYRNMDDLSSIGQRLYFAEKTWGLIQEKPLLGWGTGAYHEQFCRVADTQAWCDAGRVHPHNQILFIWVEHGVVGLALLLGLIAAPVARVWRDSGPKAVVLAGFSALFMVGSLTHGALWLSTENHFFTLMGALLASAAWASRQAGPSSRLT